jgi:hypothetical protein
MAKTTIAIEIACDVWCHGRHGIRQDGECGERSRRVEIDIIPTY